MFNREFYPTPRTLISKMIEPYYKDLSKLTVLEPSAGKGDILDYIEDHHKHRYEKVDLYAIEIEPELQYILREKKYKLISDDFLSYNGDLHFDLILMNPPFSEGDKHLLKAWEVLKTGDICCLLNAETIRNPYTETRKLLQKIIEDNGTVEFIGSQFCNGLGAERLTGAEIALVRLKKKTDNGLKFNFQSVSSEENMKIDESMLNNVPAVRDVIGNMMLQFQSLKTHFVKYMEQREAINFYKQGLLTQYTSMSEIIKNSMQEDSTTKRFNKFADQVRLELWRVVINKMGMDRYMTKQVRENFEEFTQQQGAMDFTKENVLNLIKTLFHNKEGIMEQAVINVFDLFTMYHKENRCYVEGWKTNDHYKVNKKIILPYWIDYDLKWAKEYGTEFEVNYHNQNDAQDIDKVMCYITGTNYENCITLYESLTHRFKSIGRVRPHTEYDNRGASQFFTYRFFKKGTLHIEFKDNWLWQEFNMRACKGKNWLPQTKAS